MRAGKDPVTRADGTILSAMGLPGGGVISVGKTHALVRAGDVSEPTALLLGPRVLDNAGLYLDYADFQPDHVASLISSQLASNASPRDVESTGAATAAALIAELL